MEDESVNTQEVAETGEVEVVDTSENTTQEVAETETQETQETQDNNKTEERNYEKDAAYASLRRQLEEARQGKEKAEQDLKTMTSERERLANSLGLFGFKGNTDDIEDQAKSYFSGTPVEQVRQERIAAQQVLREQQERQNELEKLKQENARLIKEQSERIFAEDLKKIQAINPNVKSLDELGNKWWQLMAAGFTAEGAYRAVEADNNVDKKTPPPEMGKISASNKADKTYYTPEEVDALTSKQLDDPVIFANVRKSMTKWK